MYGGYSKKTKGIITVVWLGLIVIGGMTGGEKSNSVTPPKQTPVAVEQKQETTKAPAPEVKKEEPKKEDVPRQHKNALRSAENYLSMMPFSKEGLYQQLTSEAGDKYPADAARYAVENVKTDWNQNALKAAKNYLQMMPMSDADLHQQLTSDAGDKYTQEQADYAIAHLNN